MSVIRLRFDSGWLYDQVGTKAEIARLYLAVHPCYIVTVVRRGTG